MFIKNIRYSTWVTGDRIVVISVLYGSTCFFLLHFAGEYIIISSHVFLFFLYKSHYRQRN